MRAKKLFAVLLAVSMLCMTFITTVSAEEPVDEAGDDSIFPVCEVKFDGEYYHYYDEPLMLERGSEHTVSIENVTYGGEPVAADKITYEWYSDRDGSNLIPEETGSQYTFTYQGGDGYSCMITVQLENGELRSSTQGFYLKEDSLTVSGSADRTYEEDPEVADLLWLRNVALGEGGTLTVTSSSTITTSTITYQWYYHVIDAHYEEPQLIQGATSNTYTFTKTDVGEEVYRCEVSDGNVTQVIDFWITPRNTLTINPQINGVTGVPIPIGGGEGYLYGTQVGKTLDLKINATSTSPIKYTWSYADKDGNVTTVGDTDLLSVTKKDDENSTYSGIGVEDYICWINDGNENKQVMFTLFLLQTEASDVETPEGTLSTSISNSNEVTEDMDTFLKNSDEVQEALDNGKVVCQIKLDTTVKANVDPAEETKINSALPESGVVGMYLDMNLYADVREGIEGLRAPSGEDIKITETGSPVSVTMEVPKSMLNADSTVDRTYEVVRVHDGVAETLGCEFKDNKVTFSTDKFSTYALAYTDEKKTLDGGQGTGTGGSNEGQGTGTGSNSGAKAETVDTGDASHIGGYVLALLLASGAFVGMIIKKRTAQ